MFNTKHFKKIPKKRKITVAWILLTLWMAVIFLLSHQNAEISSNTSGSIVLYLLKIFYPGFNNFNTHQQFLLIEDFQGVIRKGAHFTAYGILGILAYNAFFYFRIRKNSLKVVLPFVFCITYAITDEIHQYFIPGRSCELRDILIDSLGSLTFICLWLLIIRFINQRLTKNKKLSSNTNSYSK